MRGSSKYLGINLGYKCIAWNGLGAVDVCQEHMCAFRTQDALTVDLLASQHKNAAIWLDYATSQFKCLIQAWHQFSNRGRFTWVEWVILSLYTIQQHLHFIILVSRDNHIVSMKQRHTQHGPWFIRMSAHHHDIAPDSSVIWNLRLSKLTIVQFGCCFFKEFPIAWDAPWQTIVMTNAAVFCQSSSHKNEGLLFFVCCHLYERNRQEQQGVYTSEMAWIRPIKCMHIRHKPFG